VEETLVKKALFFVSFVLLVMLSGICTGMDLSFSPPPKKIYLKMESILGELTKKYAESKILAQDFAREREIPFEDEKVTVILNPPPGKETEVIDQKGVTLYGGIIEAVSRHFIRAKIPVSSLGEIAQKVAGISYIRLPAKPLALTISEGVNLSGAPNYHYLGYRGQYVKVAIIDLGFEGLSAAQARGELPYNVITMDFTGWGIETDTEHGTAVAEIVYDIAPLARLYLVKVGDEVDLENAKDWCVLQGIKIINHSVGWFNFNFTDGSGVICEIVDEAREEGILWVNSAGNSARRHYQDFFVDTDDDGWHNFSPGDDTNAIHLESGDWVVIHLTWDCWTYTDQDYDLYLLGPDHSIVASSENIQDGIKEPTESIIYEAKTSGTYHIAIYNYKTTWSNQLKIFTFYHDLQYQTPEHSLTCPADAAGVMSVAAINWHNWATGPQESFSSQGPTNDGRIKPDISGPDGVSTFTYGPGAFLGTSSSSPHVAGAAAVLLSRYSSLSVDELQKTLESWAKDLGVSGKDNIYGAGRLNLPLLSPVGLTLEDVKVYPNPFGPSGGKNEIVFDELRLNEYIKLSIFTLNGELVYEWKGSTQNKSYLSWDVRNMNGERISRGIYLYVITNEIGEKKIGKIAILK